MKDYAIFRFTEEEYARAKSAQSWNSLTRYRYLEFDTEQECTQAFERLKAADEPGIGYMCAVRVPDEPETGDVRGAV